MASKPQIMANTIKRKDQTEAGLRRCEGKGVKKQELCFRACDGWEGVRELGSHAMATLCVTVLLSLCIITGLVLRGVSALGKRCLGPDFKLY